MPLISVNKTFKYEVAFSFLQEDESLALQINDLIQDRFSTFIYSDKQTEIVGTDGEETFRKVFFENSRIVIVLYRENWGKTPFTRIEENALKLRNIEEGPDFILIISLDKNKPKWISNLQMWYDFERFGIKSIPAIVENKVISYGGQIHEETIIEQAKRNKREIDRQIKLNNYLLSIDAVNDCIKEFNALINIAENNIEEIIKLKLVSNIRTTSSFNKFIIFSDYFGLTFNFEQKAINTLQNSYLEIYVGNPDYYRPSPSRPGSKIEKEQYIFYLNEADTKGWVRKSDKQEFKTSEQLVCYWQKHFLEFTKNKRIQKEYER